MSSQIRDFQATVDLLYEKYFEILTITPEKV